MTDGGLRDLDFSIPHSARIWNYWLGGKDNFQADRDAGEDFLAVYPDQREKARACRRFIARAVRHLVLDEGVRQFLDVGTGLPTAENTHTVAQHAAPEAKIVYVDNDPMVLAHARALLTSSPEGVTHYIDADLHDPATILAGAAKVLDLDRPVALLLIGVLGHVEDYAEARSILGTLLDGLAPGSFLVHCDGDDTDAAYNEAVAAYADSGGVPYNARTREQLAGFHEGLEPVDPGVLPIPWWRPEPTDIGVPRDVAEFGGVSRIR